MIKVSATISYPTVDGENVVLFGIFVFSTTIVTRTAFNLSHRQDSKDVHQTDVLNRERMDKTGPDRISIDKEYF